MFFPNLLDHKCQSDLRNPNQSEFADFISISYNYMFYLLMYIIYYTHMVYILFLFEKWIAQFSKHGDYIR